jgi:hypothetical protein
VDGFLGVRSMGPGDATYDNSFDCWGSERGKKEIVGDRFASETFDDITVDYPLLLK